MIGSNQYAYYCQYANLTFIQNVVLALMASVVRLAVIHVSTESVTDLTEIVHMVALRVLKKIAVILQV